MNMEAEKSKILLIDDEKDILTFFSQVFQSFSHIQFFTAVNARQGIEIAKQENPKVILLDLLMPGLSGEDALKELKPLLPDTKFIVMSGWDDGDTKDKMLNEYGVEAFFDKPLNLEKVVAKIFSVLMVR